MRTQARRTRGRVVGLHVENETFSEFAMYEAALLRAELTDQEWEELLQHRPSLKAALEARQRAVGP